MAKPVATSQQYRYAELLVEGKKTIVECYIEAYGQTEEQCKDRQKLASRAYMASKGKGVKTAIEKIQAEQAVEEARLLVWDKRKAAKFLLDMCKEIQVNVDFAKQMRGKMMNDPAYTTAGKIKMLYDISKICNETVQQMKDIMIEMNSMYGLSNPKVGESVPAVQIIIESEEKLPEDTVDDI